MSQVPTRLHCLAGIFVLLLQLQYVVAGDVREIQRHSFKPPFTGTQIPFWNIGAGACVNTSYVRLTPARQSRTGFIWNNVKQTTMTDWEVIFEFQVSGMRSLGGDGFAFWYVEKPELLGTVYGSQDYWLGLGVFFDSFNNDGKGDNPLITVQFNDGTQKYNQADDGDSSALGKCSYPFRNLQNPASVRINYSGSTLSIDFALHKDPQTDTYKYVECTRIENIELGLDKFFGLTAHTGDVADNHDIISFVTYDNSPPNPDILGSRERFRQRVQLEHLKPQHQELTQKDFQHEVLTLLNQIQETSNMLEMASVGMEHLIRAAINLGPAASQGSQQQPPPQQQEGGGGGGVLDSRVGEVVTQSLESLNARFEDLRGLANAGRLDAPTGQLPVALQMQENSVKNHITTAQTQLQAVFRSAFDAEIRKINDQLRVLSNDQRQLSTQISVQADSGGSNAFIYVLLILNLIAIAVVGFLSRKKDDRYSKFI